MKHHVSTFLWAVLVVAILALAVACAKATDDSQLTSQIQSSLSQDSGLQGKAITVRSSSGVVTLSGTVDNDAQRTAASRYAASIPGVKQVVNDLQVAPAAAAVAPPQDQTTQAPPPVPEKPAVKPKPSAARHRAYRETPVELASAAPAPAPRVQDPGPAPQAAPAPTPASPPAPPAPKKVTISSGTTLAIRLVDSINSETSQPGETFRATLDSPLSSEGELAIPAGYDVQGHIVDVKSAGKFAGRSELVLQLDRLMVGKRSYSLQTDQYRRQGSSRGTNTAEKVGAGAAIGAIIGGLAGGGKGAGIGAAAGGGLGGGVQAATKGQQIKLPAETVLNFTLQSPLTVTVVEEGPNAGRPKLDNPQ